MANNPRREINVSFKAKSKKAAKSLLRRIFPNITAGFYDEEGEFHPIRASRDYSPKRAGERLSRRAPKRKAKRRNPLSKQSWKKYKGLYIRVHRSGRGWAYEIFRPGSSVAIDMEENFDSRQEAIAAAKRSVG